MLFNFRFFLSLFFLVLFLPANAQLTDDFSDGDFTNNPSWSGTAVDFIVNTSNELQLDAAEAGDSYLSLAANVQDSFSVETFFRLDFAPSTSNQLRVYVSSNNANLSSDLNGYFLQIGSSGSDDALEFYRQDGSDIALLWEGTLATLGAEPAIARVKVSRTSDGTWSFFSDYTGGGNLTLEGSIIDDTYSASQFFGYFCRYTSTRTDKFFFDDINIGPLFQDLFPPALISAEADNPNQIILTFDEPLEDGPVVIPNFVVSGGITIQDVEVGPSPNQVTLDCSALQSGTNYSVDADLMEDLSGNIAGLQSTSFQYTEIDFPAANEIQINEIYADFSPIVNLPDYEFVELYNPTNKSFDLGGMEFSDMTSSVTIPTVILGAGEYLILCQPDAVSAFEVFGSAIGLPSFPALNNAGDLLSLIGIDGTTLDEVEYADSWYKDATKSQGGWTLEKINPTIFCSTSDNWTASLNLNGGTPGTQNSTFENSPDLVGPVLLDGQILNEQIIQLKFNEPVDPLFLSASFFSVQGAGNVLDASINGSDPYSIYLEIAQPFLVSNQSYTINISGGLKDCSGNEITANSSIAIFFFETEIAEAYDVLINEIMADPSPVIGLPEVEYIELYNRSTKTINLNGMLLGDRSDFVPLPFYILEPDSYVVLIPELASINFTGIDHLLEVTDFPSLGNTEDDVQLLTVADDLVHAVFYEDSWYQNSSKNDGGWSLELINPNQPCVGFENWMASGDLSGGTPGKANANLDESPDVNGAESIRAFPSETNQVLVYFSEGLLEDGALNPEHYDLPGFTILSASFLNFGRDIVLLELGENLVLGEIYTLTVKEEVLDCAGNPIGILNEVLFGLPEAATGGELIVNEVLHNPQVGGVDFVEIYNRSEKIMNIAEYVMANTDESGVLLDAKPINSDYILLPGAYVVLTENPIDIRLKYICESPYAFVETDLPTYDDKLGTVLFYRPDILGVIIEDSIEYRESWHYPLIDDLNGVSLERINPNGKGNDANNWQSAAPSAGYGTPTAQNSNYLTEVSTGELIEMPNPLFSPDGDGNEDVLLILFKGDKTGYSANLKIYDSKGRVVKTLVQNELLPNETAFKWDGTTEEPLKATIGVYIVWVELFHPDGDTYYFKGICTLAGQL